MFQLVATKLLNCWWSLPHATLCVQSFDRCTKWSLALRDPPSGGTARQSCSVLGSEDHFRGEPEPSGFRQMREGFLGEVIVTALKEE